MSGDKQPKAFSCVRCFERKVKCDKQHPCAGCVRSNVECIFRVPAAPRRRKRQQTDDLLLNKLRQYEELLQANGINPSATNQNEDGSPLSDTAGPRIEKTLNTNIDPSAPPMRMASTEGPAIGRLLVDQGKSRFVENFLWNSLADQFASNEALIASSDDEEEGTFEDTSDFIIGVTPSSISPSAFHPSAQHAFKLWQYFLENVSPLTKILHRPTFQPVLLKATADVDSIPKGLETLLFSIYAISVLSMTDSECQQHFAEPRKILLSRYREGTRRALARAKFMATSDIQVLQAFLLYTLGMRDTLDTKTLWTMSGMVSRIAQGMGVHRDGTMFGLSPFETEMRRRLWWQVSTLDFRSAELSGSGCFGDGMFSNVRVSSNYDDDEIHPEMEAFPPEKSKPGEMIACLLRCHFGRFWKEKVMLSYPTKVDYMTSLSDFINTATTLEEREKHVNELEVSVQEKYIKYCDPSIPVQFMTSLIGTTAINGMRLMAHHPKRWQQEGSIPDEERQLLWKASIKAVEVDNLCYEYPLIRRFNWHSKVYFQWQGLIYLLGELQTLTLGDQVDLAWKNIDSCFIHHSDFVEDRRHLVHVAVGNLCLKAYNAREQALINAGIPYQVPEYIEKLRVQRIPQAKRSKSISSANTSPRMDMQVDINPLDSYAATNEQPIHMQVPNQGFSQMSLTQNLPAYHQHGNTINNGMMTQPQSDFNPTMGYGMSYGDIPNDWAQWEFLFASGGQAA